MGQLDIHDDQIGRKLPSKFDRARAVSQRLDIEPVRAQDIAEQFPVKVVILDNQDSLCHCPLALHCLAPQIVHRKGR